ncbi:MAG TPA: GntR family transcriptional regulator, partial [Patescibacteria group bacterium]|nr:GntR family transcriptional regulator [Patescibacteria group bacterium]
MATFQLDPGPVPLHHQVYLDLRASLDAGEWRSGDQLPTERELAERYGCSLITVRRALGELAREARIERTRGRGTFVTRPSIRLDMAGSLSFAEEMIDQGHEPGTRLVASRSETAGAAVAAALGIEVGAPTLYVERLRLADDEPLLLEQVHLPADRFPGLLSADLESSSLYDLLARRYDAPVAFARESFVPIALSAREARLLGQQPDSLALLVEGVAYTRAGVPVEYARSYVRGDRMRYH